MSIRTTCVFATLLPLVMAGQASANIVVNGDFETPVLPATSPKLYATGESIDGWTVFGPSGADVAVLNGPFSQFGLTFSHQSGVQSLDLTGLTNTTAGVSQALATTPGSVYDLSFFVGNVRSTGIWGTSSSVQVLLDGTPFAVATYSGGPADTLGWQRFSYQFEATANSTVLAFMNLDGVTDNVNQIDAVNVAAAVPEPMTSVMWLLGAGGLAGVRAHRIRRRSSKP